MPRAVGVSMSCRNVRLSCQRLDYRPDGDLGLKMHPQLTD